LRTDAEFLGYTNFSGKTYPGGGAFPNLILPARKKEFFRRVGVSDVAAISTKEKNEPARRNNSALARFIAVIYLSA
jgi:hypothetical protein